MNIKKVGILGSGDVGKALAGGFLKYGYEVLIGSRDPGKLDDFKKSTGNKVKTGSFKEAALFGDILILAVKGKAAKDVLNIAGKENIESKIVIDTTNPIEDAPPDNGVVKFFTTLEKSLMEDIQGSFPTAKFVKAFSCIGNSSMVDPDFKGVKPTMFIAGNDKEAKKEVTHILDKFGFETEDMGGVQGARAIEPLCILWCIPGFLRNEWTHAFKLLKK